MYCTVIEGHLVIDRLWIMFAMSLIRNTYKLLKCGVCASVIQHIDNDYQLTTPS